MEIKYEEKKYYYIAIKIGNQCWSIQSTPFITSKCDKTSTIIGKHLSKSMFTLNVSRHQRKLDWLFAIVKCNPFKINEIKNNLNSVKHESEYSSIEEVLMICKLSGEKLGKNIKHCVKSMEKYYTSMFCKRIYKFKYLKNLEQTNVFMIDLYTFEDMPDSDFDFHRDEYDCSLNKIKRYSVTFSNAYFNICD